MQIEIKINGQAAELQDVLRALLNSTTEAAPTKAIKGRPQKEVTPTEAAELDKLVKELATKAAPTPIEPTPTPIEPTPIEPTPTPIEAAPSISFEEFRKAVGAAALINKEAVRAALQAYGAAKTSEVKGEDYEAIMNDLKAIK